VLYHAFPDLQWLKQQAESRFAAGKAWNGEPMPPHGWPNVILNVNSGTTLRDNIPGPLSLFSNVSGESEVTVDGRTTIVGSDYFFVSNKTQRYTLEIAKKRSAETFNIHFGDSWFDSAYPGASVDFYNKLYPKDEVVRSLQQQLSLPGQTRLQREELLASLVIHLLKVNRGEKLKLDNINASRVSTREEIIRRLHLATDHIFSNYTADISLDELSKVSMLSKFHFLRAFQQAFGKPPHKFLNEVRILKAKELLRFSDIEVSGIGKAIGIKDASSFSRLFKKYTGVYPTVFRGL
jgi:AraC family transcriptional regulator